MRLTTYFTLSYDAQRAPVGSLPPPLPELVPTLVYAIDVVKQLGLPLAWFQISQWEGHTPNEDQDELVGSCALDEAAEHGYTSLVF